jgi:hypothetical protein
MSMQACSISIESLHMYCKTLHYEDVHGRYSIVVEYTVNGDILLWERDIPAAESRRKEVAENIASAIAKGPRKLIVVWGEKRIPPNDQQ